MGTALQLRIHKLQARFRAWLYSLSGRLLFTYLALALLSMGSLIVWTGSRLQAAELEQAEHNLELQAHLIANALREPFEERGEEASHGRSLETLVYEYAAQSDTRLTVMDEQGRVVISSDEQVLPGVQEYGRELIAAASGWEQHDIRWDALTRTERLYVAAPILHDTRVIGLVQLSIPTAPLYDAMRRMWLTLLGVGGGVLLLTATVSLALARWIARPVQMLSLTSEAIAAGHLKRRVKPSGPDEIKRLGDAFNRMTDRLQDLYRRQQEFVANAAHELRSPLTGLRLRLDLVQKSNLNDPTALRQQLAEIEQQVTHLQRMVEQLLALAALDESIEAPRTWLDLAPLLYELADELSPQIRAAGVEMHVEVPPHLPPVRVNADQVRAAVRNLLDNACKYTPAGGQVTLRATTTNGTLAIAVIDTGEGIPPEALPHLFDRFYRVPRARSVRQRGSGLGLALARSMIEANGGSIQVQSTLGKGSTFTISFHLAPQVASPAQP